MTTDVRVVNCGDRSDDTVKVNVDGREVTLAVNESVKVTQTLTVVERNEGTAELVTPRVARAVESGA